MYKQTSAICQRRLIGLFELSQAENHGLVIGVALGHHLQSVDGASGSVGGSTMPEIESVALVSRGGVR